MTRLLGLLLPILLFVLAAPSLEADEVDIPPVTISGGELPFEVRLAPADADSFRRRVNKLPRLEETPVTTGIFYTVTTPYWQEAVRFEDDDEEDETVDDEAIYYPTGGYVRALLGDEPVWMVLNLRQRAILDRCIRLAIAGAIGEQASSLDVVRAAIEDETAAAAIGFEMGATLIETEDTAELLRLLTDANPSPFLEEQEMPRMASEGRWLIVTLPEGRSLRYYYDGSTLTEGLGTERYDASAASELLDGLASVSLPVLEEQEPAGSLLWWPVMIGGGLAAIGAAIWLRRRHLFH